jgi:hypothetical protein
MVHNFSDNYAQARRCFLELAQACGSEVESHLHPLKGPAGEPLAMDVRASGLPMRPMCC